jgi:hypothetical protein
MTTVRSITSFAVAAALAVGQLTVVSSGAAAAEGWGGHHRHQQAPPVSRPAAPVVARLPAPPVLHAPQPRYAAPAPRPHYGGGEHHRHHGHNGDRVAAGIALGIGALIVGSAIASSNARASSRNTEYERCAARFEDFDWNDGTIVNRDGERVVCPYLE